MIFQAQKLVADLEWLDTDFYERWRAIIFTSSSPVSWRWKALMRLLFAVSFMVFAYMSWIALGGAYRAHRQRLVWGERLMSWPDASRWFWLFPQLIPSACTKCTSWLFQSFSGCTSALSLSVDPCNIMYIIFPAISNAHARCSLSKLPISNMACFGRRG